MKLPHYDLGDLQVFGAIIFICLVPSAIFVAAAYFLTRDHE